ncbi:serine O-acetyltransferase [Enterovibrio paralichthyis]|uniref:serine O-acetyltransferase n=1 Tax=Enterovibrio paralichthyis TaxID=2853805 RepID=UPI001C4738E0|nr:serine acetyltransferase [Enterovibrio paralichthyis]MBV7299602.1 serine acetyltransferase [Enterovibrio paralichthyis]
MKKYSFLYLVKSDLYRQNGKVSLLLFLKDILFRKGFKFVFWMRAAKHFDSFPLIRYIPKIIYSYYKRVYVSDINYRADIGLGFSIYHVFCTSFGSSVKIGNNVTIVHGVTIAGKNGKFPEIKDNVYIGSGACILGGVVIGNNAIIGANATVTKDVPDNAVVVGNPARIVSYNGSSSALVNVWKEDN